MAKSAKHARFSANDGRYTSLDRGQTVTVYCDPVTRKNIEGDATVKRVIQPLMYNDCDGNRLVRCLVSFADGMDVVREVSDQTIGILY